MSTSHRDLTSAPSASSSARRGSHAAPSACSRASSSPTARFALAFLVAAVALAFLAPADARASSPGSPSALVRAYALVARRRVPRRRRLRRADADRARADAAAAPDADRAAARRARARAHHARRRAARPTSARDRVLLSVADAWLALAPALVLVLGDAQTPDWGDWPIYVAALAAQVALDSAVYVGAGVGLPRRAAARRVLAELRDGPPRRPAARAGRAARRLRRRRPALRRAARAAARQALHDLRRRARRARRAGDRALRPPTAAPRCCSAT